MPSFIGSTYIYEQLFSRLKNTKSEIRSKTTDEYLESLLRIPAISIGQVLMIYQFLKYHIEPSTSMLLFPYNKNMENQ